MPTILATSYTQSESYQATKCIYRSFKELFKAFCRHVPGIANENEQMTYIILMIKRLLVLYFFQKQGLLDADPNYLSNRLQYTQQTFGHNTFYRHFLLPLCYEQLGQQQEEHTSSIFGTIPTSGIPLFQKHALECSYPTITIADEAFIEIFTFFDSYQWRLDGHPAQNKNEIHPHILSYIFEQQIDQKQMGAYYTGEDVTTYIARNTIISSIFAKVKKQCPDDLKQNTSIWHLLKHDPDKYIYTPLYSANYLPTETQREYKVRHTRYKQLATLLQTGIVHDINDLVTHNLDILRFAQDVILTCNQPNVLLAFYRAIEQITILDPTCGSGAFLFAALTILEILYSACLTRMHTLRDEYAHQTIWHNESNQVKAAYHALFDQIARHLNQQHFILTSILAKNLYGVDVMEEATEVCKLRLYLALLASISQSQDVPSLPSLNLHIHAGNALVGSAHSTDGYNISSPASSNSSQFQADNKQADNAVSSALHSYRKGKQPFHWYEAFPQVMEKGGFDVIIGNPPYVEYSKVRHDYTVDGYEKRSCGNLYAAVIERSLTLCSPQESYLGLLVPVSICGSIRFEHLRETLKQMTSHLWLANFEIFPSRLFDGVFQRLSILLAKRDQSPKCIIHTTRIYRWYTFERPVLIDLINYNPVTYTTNVGGFPKLASKLQVSILHKIRERSTGQRIASVLSTQKTPYFVYYQEATNYWTKAVCQIPFYKKNGVVMKPSHGRLLFFTDELTAWTVMALMNSSLFYLWFATYSDGFHLTHTLVKDFPADRGLYALKALPELAIQLQNDIQTHAKISTRNTRPNPARQKKALAIELEEYRMGCSKAILDEIDQVLARHYDFSDEEVDFILNYDIKYRMGFRRE